MIQVLIDNVDKSELIQWESLVVEQNRDDEIDSCNFRVLVYQGKTFNPVYNQAVIVKEDSEVIFAGNIVGVKQGLDGNSGIIFYDIECQDYTTQLVGKLVARTYTNQTINYILADLCSAFAPTFNADNANSTFVVPKIVFNQITFLDCIKKLASIVNYSYYIDSNKSIHFFNISEGSAPFSITDEGGYEFETLERTLDGSQLVNVVKVRGGEYDGALFTDKITVKGAVTKSFIIAKKLSSLTIKVNNVSKTVGIDNVDDFATKQVLYNYQNQSIAFQNALADGDVIEYSGYPKVRVFQIAEDTSSVNQYGRIEKLIREDDIRDNVIARKRAVAELYAFSNGVIDATFETTQSGLRVGQSILIDCPSRSFVENLTIKSVTFTTDSPTTFRYKVNLINTKRANLINLLSKLLAPATLDIDEAEVDESIYIDKAELTMSEEHTVVNAFADDADLEVIETHYLDPLGAGVEPEWVLGDYFPSSETDPKRMGRLDISMTLY